MTNVLNENESLYKVEWADGADLKLKGGEIRGLLEVRDGGYEDTDQGAAATPPLVEAEFEYNESNGIPYYIKKLDEFAKVFAKTLNDIHNEGTNLNGDKGTFLDLLI